MSEPDSIVFVDHSREKLLNAIIYFVTNTKHCHTLKLFKLLNFLDFEHYRQTGRSVTRQRYVAWPNGPAPNALWHELPKPADDLRRAVQINHMKDDLTGAPKRRDIKPKIKFDASQFTKRELKIMETLAFMFLDASGEDMTEVSHARDLPWGKIYAKGAGEGKTIPYDLSLESASIIPDMPSLSAEELKARQEAFKEIEEALG